MSVGGWGHLGATLGPPRSHFGVTWVSLRIGNLLVPNDNYCKFEDWLMPILDQMVDEQDTQVRVGDPGVGVRGSLDTWGGV